MMTARAGALQLSRVVAGMWRMTEWNMTPQQRLAFIEQCLELGVSSFDHADIYGGYGVEALFGEALALKPALREQMQIVSKCGIKLVSPSRPAHAIQHYDTSAAHITASVEQSLSQLRTGYLDLLLIHRPDPLMDFDEMADTFTRLRAEGKVRHFGVSNFSRHQFEALNRRIALATNQVEFSPLHLAPMFDETFDGLQDLRRTPVQRRRRGRRAPARQYPASGGRSAAAVCVGGVRVDYAAAVQAGAADRLRAHCGDTGSGASHAVHAQPPAVVRDPARGARARSGLMALAGYGFA
jgi:hypothetical protein